MPKQKIDTQKALEPVRKYCLENPDRWFTGAVLYENVEFEEDWNVTKHGLTQALSLTAALRDPHKYLRPVSQVRVLPDSRAKPYGVFYGYSKGLIPAVWDAGWPHSVNGVTDRTIKINRIRKVKGRKIDEEFPIEIGIINYKPYKDIGESLLKIKEGVL